MKILVAGFGNVLHQDDGFGVYLLHRLERRAAAHPGVTFLEAGIGGISLVQELLGGYEAVVLLDAVEDGAPGDVRLLAVEVADVAAWGTARLRDHLADIHYAEPGRAMALARAIGSLPELAYVVGCVPARCGLGEGLSPRVAAALDPAAARVEALLETLSRGRRPTVDPGKQDETDRVPSAARPGGPGRID